jgi:hypothetical protein
MQAHTNLYLLMLNTAPAGSYRYACDCHIGVIRDIHFTYTSRRSP